MRLTKLTSFRKKLLNSCGMFAFIFFFYLLYGHFEDETATVMVIVVKDEISTETMGMALGKGQAEAETFGEVIDLGEEVEHTLAVFLRDAGSVVLADETNGGAGIPYMQFHVLSVRIFGSVIEQFTQAEHEIGAAGDKAEVVGDRR